MADGSRFFDHGHGHGHGAHLCLSVGRSLSPLLERRGTNDVSVFSLGYWRRRSAVSNLVVGMSGICDACA